MSERCPTCGHRTTWTKPAIFSALHTWVKEHGEPPTVAQWLASSPFTPNSKTCQRMFGSWNNMMREAGLTTRSRGRNKRVVQFTRKQIVAVIFEFRFAHGRLPMYEDWIHPAEGRPTAGQVERAFGSWNSAIVAAGYAPRKPRRSDDGYRQLTEALAV